MPGAGAVTSFLNIKKGRIKHLVGAKIGIGIRGGTTHIEPERPRIIPIIPITTEIGATTGTKSGTNRHLFFIYQS